MLFGWFLVWLISHKNPESGLGKVSKILLPLLFVLTIIIVAILLFLQGASIGLSELFHPNWESLFDFGIWISAFGQIVFSLGAGMTIVFTYASYSQDDADLITNTFIVTLSNALFEKFVALCVFSILSHMSLQSGVGVEKLVEEGARLIFIVYPTIFNVLCPWISF